MLHQDNPPHWHLSYYPGAGTGATPATVPQLRDGARWRTVTTDDRVGIMRIDVSGVDADPVRERVEYEYDPLTGPVLHQRPF
jgi:hypothetical protein